MTDDQERLAVLLAVRDGGGPRSRAEAGCFWDVLEYLHGDELNDAGVAELARLEAAE